MIDPRPIPTFQLWADLMYPQLQQQGNIQQVIPGDDWQTWAVGLLSFNRFVHIAIPDPYLFNDWKDWAMRFNEVYEGNG